MVKTPTRNLIFCALGCTFLVHFVVVVVLFCFVLPCTRLLTTAGLNGIFQLRLGLKLICLNSVMLNLVKSGR